MIEKVIVVSAGFNIDDIISTGSVGHLTMDMSLLTDSVAASFLFPYY